MRPALVCVQISLCSCVYARGRIFGFLRLSGVQRYHLEFQENVGIRRVSCRLTVVLRDCIIGVTEAIHC